MGLILNKGLSSIENIRTKIFYISAIFTIVGELTDSFTSNHPRVVIIAGYVVIGIAITVTFLRFRNILNNTWANLIIVYFLLLDVISTLYFLIGQEEFHSYFIRVSVLLFVIIPYAGFNINKYHCIIVGSIFIANYIIISFLSRDELLIRSIPVIFIIGFTFVLEIYLIIHNLILINESKEVLLKKTEQANIALTIREQDLKKEIESKNALFSVISHDLRNPFNTIIGFNDLIDIALQKNDIEKIRKYHPLIKRSTENAYSLINNLFDWVRSQKKNINFTPSKFMYNRLVNNAIALVSNEAKRKNITIKSEVPEEHIIVADMNMIAAVLRNLITNAIKFTKEDGEIEIGIENRNYKILYYIKDSGIGASKEKLEKMFSGQPIESEPGTMHENGSGLGLNICKGFIDKHRGKIWAETNEKKGLTVFFTIGV